MDLYKNSEISVQELKKLIDLDSNIQIVDIRDDSERKLVSLRNTINIKLSDLANSYSQLDLNKNVFVMCHTGTRSQAVCKWLKSKGYMNCVNVLGGIDAWAALIDRNIRRY